MVHKKFTSPISSKEGAILFSDVLKDDSVGDIYRNKWRQHRDPTTKNLSWHEQLRIVRDIFILGEALDIRTQNWHNERIERARIAQEKNSVSKRKDGEVKYLADVTRRPLKKEKIISPAKNQTIPFAEVLPDQALTSMMRNKYDQIITLPLEESQERERIKEDYNALDKELTKRHPDRQSLQLA